MPDHIPYTGTDFLVHERASGIRFAAHGLHGVPKHEGRGRPSLDESGVGPAPRSGAASSHWARRLLATMSPLVSPRPGEAPPAP